ncbi:hypothetical protein IC175_17240 [Clostridioides sp. ES-S-0123-01]|uniref:hypothetical protein n=1 Tax=Clostridioides sp. ES-S-0123-01 TaxID=2770783 RepID=UPI001D0FA669|nr:hypothetical protein [Clostridioides sp. ES-S-0123-01]
MDYYIKDMNNQFNNILKIMTNTGISDVYESELRNIFSSIYSINYLKNKIELRHFFETQYFDITFSCLLESFSLLLNNYQRGALLVLRSSLENFIKHIIQEYNQLLSEEYKINDRSYTANKVELEKIIKNNSKWSLKNESRSLNSRMENSYKKLSALSHSLTSESKNNILNYFSDINVVNDDNIRFAINNTIEVLQSIFSFSIIICESSFKYWDSYELNKILKLVFGDRKSQTYIRNIKE